MAKAKLAMQINLLIKQEGLSQKAAAELLGVDQPKISALHKGKLTGFSIERLFRFLNILGQNIIINISPETKTQKKPNISVRLQKAKQMPLRDIEAVKRNAVIAKKKE